MADVLLLEDGTPRLTITREELAAELGHELWDIEEACRRGDIPTIRCGGAIEVPAVYLEAVRDGRRQLPQWLTVEAESPREEGSQSFEATPGDEQVEVSDAGTARSGE